MVAWTMQCDFVMCDKVSLRSTKGRASRNSVSLVALHTRVIIIKLFSLSSIRLDIIKTLLVVRSGGRLIKPYNYYIIRCWMLDAGNLTTLTAMASTAVSGFRNHRPRRV